MIVMAVVRTALAPLPSGVIDTSWLVFWQGIEAATAVIVVSLSASRGLFGREGSRSSKRSKQYRPSHEGGASAGRPNQKQYEGLPEPPAKAKQTTFFRYKGASVMDEESQIVTMDDLSDRDAKEEETQQPMTDARLDKPFSSTPHYSVMSQP